MSRRYWRMPDETLGNKAFRFGIFCSRIGSVKTLPLHCFVTEICRIPIARNPHARETMCVRRYCPAGEALLRLWGGASLRKCFRIMVPILGFSSSLPGKWPDNARLCDRSHMQSGHCRNVKNLTLHIEPPASPVRPTLRDGH